MELLCDVGHAKSHSDPFGDGVSVGAIGARFAPNVPQAEI
jgi:hypothetical protein